MAKRSGPAKTRATKRPLGEKDRADLEYFFLRNGYLRLPNQDRQEADGPNYKKGYEARMTAYTKTELAYMRRLLRLCGVRPPKFFQKGKRWQQPIYGKEAIQKVLAMLKSVPAEIRKSLK